MKKSNIVLIGMPSSGKTTIGKLLAGGLGMGFVDTDEIIREKAGKPLRDIVNEDGLEAFLDIQQKAVTALDVRNHVIATGGSVVYGSASMEHLKKDGVVVFLKSELCDIEKRVAAGRRLARTGGQTVAELYNERMPLYQKYADITVNCSGKTEKEIADEILDIVKNYGQEK